MANSHALADVMRFGVYASRCQVCGNSIMYRDYLDLEYSDAIE